MARRSQRFGKTKGKGKPASKLTPKLTRTTGFQASGDADPNQWWNGSTQTLHASATTESSPLEVEAATVGIHLDGAAWDGGTV
jgi:hypothetical protein